jgi:hypothetical protein
VKITVAKVVSRPAVEAGLERRLVEAALKQVIERASQVHPNLRNLPLETLGIDMPVPLAQVLNGSCTERAAADLLAGCIYDSILPLLQPAGAFAADVKVPGALLAAAKPLTPGSTEAYRLLDRIVRRDINAGNAQEVLTVVHLLDTKKSEYRLRQRCVQSSSKIGTPLAYTDSSLPAEKAKMKEYIKKPASWCPRRAEIHRQIIAQEMKKADAVSKRMLGASGGKPTVLMMRGNSGSGKTYTLQNSDHKAIRGLNVTKAGAKGDPKGLLNPDDIKYLLASKYEGGRATSSQVHPEGSMITETMVDAFFREKKSMVLDKRFGQAKEVQDEVCAEAKRHGYRIVMIDLDASLDTSCKRVAKRELKGKAPNVEFKAVAHGFQEIRGDRPKIKKLCEDGDLDGYFLFKSDGPKAGTLIASSENGVFQIFDEELWQEAITAGEAEVMSSKGKWEEYMDKKASGVDPETVNIQLPS